MARSAETKTQLIRRAAARTKDRRQGQDRPYFGWIKEYNATADTTLVDNHGGRRLIFNPQPHLGRTAWMRAAPESGMGSLLITRSDTEAPEIMRWWHTDTQQRLLLFRNNVENLASGTGELVSNEAFRTLDEGEIDLVSRGGASLYMGNRPVLDMRAGIVMLTMDQDEVEFGTKAPLHIRRGYQNSEAIISDEERFGVVRRQDSLSYINRFFPDDKGNRGEQSTGFAKEHLMRLTNAQTTSPTILLDTRAGNVIDDAGKPIKLDDTGLNLRCRAEYFTPSETSVLMQLDESGNFKIEHPSDATTGGTFVLPSGTLNARVGIDFKRSVGHNEQVVIGVDKVQNIGNDDTKVVGNRHKVIVTGNEIRVMQANASETVFGQKTIQAAGISLTAAGASGASKASFSSSTSSFETETLTIYASKEIIFESPSITMNTATLNVTGTIKTGGLLSNSGIVAPNLHKENFSGTKGTAGRIPAKEAIRT